MRGLSCLVWIRVNSCYFVAPALKTETTKQTKYLRLVDQVLVSCLLFCSWDFVWVSGSSSSARKPGTTNSHEISLIIPTNIQITRTHTKRKLHEKNSPPSKGGVAAASADGVVLSFPFLIVKQGVFNRKKTYLNCQKLVLLQNTDSVIERMPPFWLGLGSMRLIQQGRALKKYIR